MNAFKAWLLTVRARLQWLFAIPPTKRQLEERARAMAVFDAAFECPPQSREELH